ncbi:hypothetical protein JCM1841_000474 [Sporobolomyces salmonicolor]
MLARGAVVGRSSARSLAVHSAPARAPAAPQLQRLAPKFSCRFIANNAVEPQIGPQNQWDLSGDSKEDYAEANGKGGGGGGGPSPGKTSLDSAIATGAGVVLIAAAGLFYHYWYKWEVLRKMERAFTKGYDPVLELASASKFEEDGSVKKGRIRRKEQEYIEKIINGESEYSILLIVSEHY